MRYITRAILPLGEGRILDPFMGGGSTIAAADNVGYDSVGIEVDEQYYNLAQVAIPLLAKLYNVDNNSDEALPVQRTLVESTHEPLPAIQEQLFQNI